MKNLNSETYHSNSHEVSAEILFSGKLTKKIWMNLSLLGFSVGGHNAWASMWMWLVSLGLFLVNALKY